MLSSSALQSLNLLLLASSAQALLSPTLIYGPGSLDLRLTVAKLVARAGSKTAIYNGNADDRLQKQWRRLMHGAAYADEGVDAPGCAAILPSTEALGASLAEAQALVCVCDTAALRAGSERTLLDEANSPALQRVCLVSKMGATRAKAGIMGFGGTEALTAGEAALREAAAERGVELSIVRVGTLKGGGPGRVENNEVIGAGDGVELGLAKAYYDGLAELETYLTTQSYDKFTLGARLAAGDPIDMANPLLQMGRRGSFEPFDDETSRIVAAQAVVQALCHDTAVELSVSAAKGEAPPTADEWAALFEGLAA